MTSPIENVTVENNVIKFVFKGSVSDANRLRIIFLTKIKTLAFDNVHMLYNKSVVPDEYIMHRIQLIPILNIDNCDLTTYSAKFNSKPGTNYSENIELDEKCKGVLPSNIIIMKCNETHKFGFKTNIVPGIGENHIKWSAVSVAFFRKVKDDFYFTVESIGQYTPENLLKKALEVYTSE